MPDVTGEACVAMILLFLVTGWVIGWLMGGREADKLMQELSLAEKRAVERWCGKSRDERRINLLRTIAEAQRELRRLAE